MSPIPLGILASSGAGAGFWVGLVTGIGQAVDTTRACAERSSGGAYIGYCKANSTIDLLYLDKNGALVWSKQEGRGTQNTSALSNLKSDTSGNAFMTFYGSNAASVTQVFTKAGNKLYGSQVDTYNDEQPGPGWIDDVNGYYYMETTSNETGFNPNYTPMLNRINKSTNAQNAVKGRSYNAMYGTSSTGVAKMGSYLAWGNSGANKSGAAKLNASTLADVDFLAFNAAPLYGAGAGSGGPGRALGFNNSDDYLIYAFLYYGSWRPGYIARWNAAKTLVWGRHIPDDAGILNDWAVDANDNIYLAMNQRSLIKIAANGTFLWSRTFGFNGTSELKTVDVDADGNVVIGGQTSITGTMSPWIAKISQDGPVAGNYAVGSYTFRIANGTGLSNVAAITTTGFVGQNTGTLNASVSTSSISSVTRGITTGAL